MAKVDVVMHTLARLGDALAIRSWAPAPGGDRITDHQLRLLRLLDDSDPVMVGELADHLGVTASTMSLNLKRLEASGLAERSRDPADRRVMNVLLTAKGRAIRDSAPLFDAARVDALLMSLRPDELERALAALSVLAEAASRLDADHLRYVDSLAGGASR